MHYYRTAGYYNKDIPELAAQVDATVKSARAQPNRAVNFSLHAQYQVGRGFVGQQ